MVECSFTNEVAVGSNAVAVTVVYAGLLKQKKTINSQSNDAKRNLVLWLGSSFTFMAACI